MSEVSLSILIIDDCEEDREMMVRYLKQVSPHGNFQIVQADSGMEGWELCQRENPDCILIDYQIPDLDGLEFLQSLSKDKKRQFFPVLMLTGQGNEHVASDAMKSGASDYLVKGKLTAEGLYRAVTRAIEKSSLLRINESQRLEMERSQRELEQFAYTASHDLQAPVRRVIKFLELIELDLQENISARSRDYLSRAMKGALHMRRLIQDLLDFSLIGGAEKIFEPVNLETVLKEVLAQLEVTIVTTGASITVGPLPTVLGNRTFLQQLFQNLIANALKFRSDNPPLVEISGCEQDSMFVVTVKDNGVGIPVESFEKIFGVFQRVDNGTNAEGTGIGLALCKKIIELHDGRIWVESEQGVGTAFQLTFPQMVQQLELVGSDVQMNGSN